MVVSNKKKKIGKIESKKRNDKVLYHFVFVLYKCVSVLVLKYIYSLNRTDLF